MAISNTTSPLSHSPHLTPSQPLGPTIYSKAIGRASGARESASSTVSRIAKQVPARNAIMSGRKTLGPCDGYPPEAKSSMGWLGIGQAHSMYGQVRLRGARSLTSKECH